jgi:hypothetical protein
MLELPNVTLCVVDTDHPEKGMTSLCRSMYRAKFGNVKFITSFDGANSFALPVGVELHFCDKFPSVEDYCKFLMKDLFEYIDTDFVLLQQWDSWILNPQLWTNEFLNYDYIGAPWPIYWNDIGTPERQVGNGGFSLRSKKLLDTLSVADFPTHHPEDVVICRDQRPWLEDMGVRYAPIDLARRFSYECGDAPEGGSFGFHGIFNLNWAR